MSEVIKKDLFRYIGADCHKLLYQLAFSFDVPDNCIVIGNPGRIIQKEISPAAKYHGTFVVENFI